MQAPGIPRRGLGDTPNRRTEIHLISSYQMIKSGPVPARGPGRHLGSHPSRATCGLAGGRRRRTGGPSEGRGEGAVEKPARCRLSDGGVRGARSTVTVLMGPVSFHFALFHRESESHRQYGDSRKPRSKYDLAGRVGGCDGRMG
jgi:hypothetical protein